MRIDLYGYEDLELKVYDPETKQVIAVYKNFTKASKCLGISDQALKRCCINKTRKHSPVLNKEVAIRLTKKTKQ